MPRQALKQRCAGNDSLDNCPHPIEKKYCLSCIQMLFLTHDSVSVKHTEYLTRPQIHTYTDCASSPKTVQCATEGAHADYSCGCAFDSRIGIISRMAIQPRMGLLPQRRFGACGRHPGGIAAARKNLEQP